MCVYQCVRVHVFFGEQIVALSRITKSSKNKYQKNLFLSVYKSSFLLFFFFISPRVWGKKGLMESSRNHFVPFHFPETSHQRLHALSLVGFIRFSSEFVHVVEAKSEVFTADKAEHCLVKVVVVLDFSEDTRPH